MTLSMSPKMIIMGMNTRKNLKLKKISKVETKNMRNLKDMTVLKNLFARSWQIKTVKALRKSRLIDLWD